MADPTQESNPPQIGSVSFNNLTNSPVEIKGNLSVETHIGGDQVAGDKITHIYQTIHSQQVDEETLAQAQDRLAHLPLDHLPPPAPLPPGSRMPFARNPLFVGREQALLHLARALKAGETAAIGQIAAATGLGGIGKSQLAVEFAHRYGQYFSGGVFWLSFADPAAIPAEIAGCGGAGHLEIRPDFGHLSLEEQVGQVASAWRSPLPRLLVFDNCEDEALLDHWRSRTGGCRVLVTSRRSTWSRMLGVQVYPLDVLARGESIALLAKHRPDLSPDDPHLAALAAELGDLPLALHLAGSVLEFYQADPTLGNPANFLAELRDARLLDHPALQGEDVTGSPTGHILHVGRTFALSYERLNPAGPVDALAQQLLARTACFAWGEPIPRQLLLATLDQPEADRQRARLAAKALRRLVELGLLEEEATGALVLHRLLAAFVQQLLPLAEAQATVEETLLAEARRLNQAGYPAPLLAWQPHLRAVTEAAQAREDEWGAGLCNELGYHLRTIGAYTEAWPYYERALAINEKVLGADHPDTALSLNNLGTLLYMQGAYAEAWPYYERALTIYEKVLGAEHPDTASSLNNVGALLDAIGAYVEARPYYERALAINEKVLGPEHPATATSLNNLGYLLKMQGMYAEAWRYYERALTIREKVLGPEHPVTATSLNNLGTLLQAQGAYAEARLYFERVLTIREKALGAEHPDTAHSLNNLGCLLQAQGAYAEAWLYFERALAILKARLGPDHPYTRTVQGNLAALDAEIKG